MATQSASSLYRIHFCSSHILLSSLYIIYIYIYICGGFDLLLARYLQLRGCQGFIQTGVSSPHPPSLKINIKLHERVYDKGASGATRSRLRKFVAGWGGEVYLTPECNMSPSVKHLLFPKFPYRQFPV